MKLPKFKMKESWGKNIITYKGIPVELSLELGRNPADQERVELDIPMLKEKMPASILYLEKLSFSYQREITFLEKQKLRQFITTRPAFQEIQAEMHRW